MALPALAGCLELTLGIERSMQDGLRDMTGAERLRGEALYGIGATRIAHAETCAFLRESADRLERAHRHYRECTRLRGITLDACPGQDWSRLSADPKVCEAQILDIEAYRVMLDDEIATQCRP